MSTLSFTVTTSNGATSIRAQSSDVAVEEILAQEKITIDNFLTVYQDNPTPHVSGKYGAPLGRSSRPLCHDMLEDHNSWTATPIELDEGGYDDGGAYWGLRFDNTRIYAVQDGIGNIAFFDASCTDEALLSAKEQ